MALLLANKSRLKEKLDLEPFSAIQVYFRKYNFLLEVVI